jgi:hypothetical protein
MKNNLFFNTSDFEGPMALNRWVKHGSYEYKEILQFVTERANNKLAEHAKVAYETKDGIFMVMKINTGLKPVAKKD